VNKFLLCALLTTTVFVSASSKDAGRTRSRRNSRAEAFLDAFNTTGKPGKGGLNGNSPTGVVESVFTFDAKSRERARSVTNAFQRAAAMSEVGLTPISLIGSISPVLQKMKLGETIFCRDGILNSKNPDKDNLLNVHISRLPVGTKCGLVPHVVFAVEEKCNGSVGSDYERKSLRYGRPKGTLLRILSNSAFSDTNKK